MVGGEVEILPGKGLLFTWKTKVKLFELIEAQTEKQFAVKMGELQAQDQLNNELYEKMYFIGFNWKKDAPIITKEETADIIEEFCQVNKFGSEEVKDKLIESLCNSGILNKGIIAATKKLQQDILENRISELVESRGIDTGEPSTIQN